MEPNLTATAVTCHMGSHSVTFHPTQVNIPRIDSSRRPVLDLPTPKGWKADLAYVTGYITRWFTRPQTVTHPSTNPAVHGRESHSQPVDHKSDALTTTPPSNLVIYQCWVLVLNSKCTTFSRMMMMMTMVVMVMAIVMQDDAGNCNHDRSGHPTNRRYWSIRCCGEIGVRTIAIRFGSLHLWAGVFQSVIWVGINARRLYEYHYCPLPLASLASAVPHQ